MLFGVVLGLSGFFKTRDASGTKAIIDDVPFRLFYGFTCGILFLSSALIGIPDLVGNNIKCYSHGRDHKAIEQYCWVSGTHLLVNGGDDDRGLGRGTFHGEERCHRDLDGHYKTADGTECIRTQSYYQWVPYVLFLQGCLFFLPRLFWKKFEEGKMSSVSEGVRLGTASTAGYKERARNVAVNVANYINLDEAGHIAYGIGYISAQILNLLILILAYMFTNHFLDGQFLGLGHKWMAAFGDDDNSSSWSVLYQVFPRITRCEFQSYGTAGGLKVEDFLCILAPNIISEKIFVFLWFWYATLAVIMTSNIALVTLMATRSLRIRSYFMMVAAKSNRMRRYVTSSSSLRSRIESMSFGKFLFLYLLGKNVDYFTYKRILDLAIGEDLNDAGDGGVNIKEDRSRGGRLTREVSRPNVVDAASEEVIGDSGSGFGGLPKYDVDSVTATAPESPGQSQRTLPSSQSLQCIAMQEFKKQPLPKDGE